MVNICIVHYNTPQLTECLIKSINKFTPNCKIYIFDNSDKKPFTYRQDNIVYFDNTKGEIIDFEKWLENYPEKKYSSACKNNFGSAKHCYSVQKCIDLIDDNFIRIDADCLLVNDISSIALSSALYVGELEIWKPKNPAKNIIKNATTRVKPYLMYINVELCKKYNISYYNDHHIYGLTVEGDYYDTGTYFYEQCSKIKDVPKQLIKLDNYILHYKGASWLEAARKYNNYKNIDPMLWLDKNKKYWYSCYPKNVKNVIYTCITNKYDLLKENINLQDYDFVCFTDDPTLCSETWIIKKIPEKLKDLSPVKQQRYIKTHPHEFFPEYEYSIWVDANVEVLKDPTDILLSIKDESVLIPHHPYRNCIYKEGKECIRLKKDTAENVNPQLNRYKEEGFPVNIGLVQSNIIIRKHNEEDCIKLMEAWWEEIERGSHRDQLSFNYALWKNPTRFAYLNKTLYKSKWFNWKVKHEIAANKVNIQAVYTNFGVNYDIIREKIIEDPTTKIDKIIQRPDPKIDKVIQLPTPIKRIFY